MLTLRQIEVIRAIMITGTIAGAAKLLNVSAPGISRLMKHTERTLRLKLFERRHGRYVPTPEAKDIFEQINGVYRRSTTCIHAVAHIKRGKASSFHRLNPEHLPRRTCRARSAAEAQAFRPADRHQRAEDRGGARLSPARPRRDRAMSYKLDHPANRLRAAGDGRAALHRAGRAPSWLPPLRSRPARSRGIPSSASTQNDPYGRIMSEIFRRQGLPTTCGSRRASAPRSARWSGPGSASR